MEKKETLKKYCESLIWDCNSFLIQFPSDHTILQNKKIEIIKNQLLCVHKNLMENHDNIDLDANLLKIYNLQCDINYIQKKG